MWFNCLYFSWGSWKKFVEYTHVQNLCLGVIFLTLNNNSESLPHYGPAMIYILTAIQNHTIFLSCTDHWNTEMPAFNWSLIWCMTFPRVKNKAIRQGRDHDIFFVVIKKHAQKIILRCLLGLLILLFYTTAAIG